MTLVGRGFVFQASAVALLLLALSPLTAPFSTWHHSDLFNATDPGVAATLEPKITADHKVAVPRLGPALLAAHHSPARLARPLPGAERATGLRHLPLRL